MKNQWQEIYLTTNFHSPFHSPGLEERLSAPQCVPRGAPGACLQRGLKVNSKGKLSVYSSVTLRCRQIATLEQNFRELCTDAHQSETVRLRVNGVMGASINGSRTGVAGAECPKFPFVPTPRTSYWVAYLHGRLFPMTIFPNPNLFEESDKS